MEDKISDMTEMYLLCNTQPLDSLQDPLKRTTRLKYNCLSVSSRYIVIGANTGGVYIFSRLDLKLVQIIFADKAANSVSIIQISPSEKLVAFYSLNSIHVVEMRLDGRSKPETLRSTEISGCSVTCIFWDHTSSKVYIGDDLGRVSVMPVYSNKAKNLFSLPLEVILKLDSMIVQLDKVGDKILVSTWTRCYLCDSTKQQFSQIGTRLRDGQFGACFLQQPLSDAATIYCARPGSRIWEVDYSGTVMNTHQFKQLLATPPTPVLQPHICAYEGADGQKYDPQTVSFPKLKVVCNSFLVSWTSTSIYILDPLNVKVILWTNTFTDIQDLCCIGDQIFVFFQNMHLHCLSLIPITKAISFCLATKAAPSTNSYISAAHMILHHTERIQMKPLKDLLNAETCDKLYRILTENGHEMTAKQLRELLESSAKESTTQANDNNEPENNEKGHIEGNKEHALNVGIHKERYYKADVVSFEKVHNAQSQKEILKNEKQLINPGRQSEDFLFSDDSFSSEDELDVDCESNVVNGNMKHLDQSDCETGNVGISSHVTAATENKVDATFEIGRNLFNVTLETKVKANVHADSFVSSSRRVVVKENNVEIGHHTSAEKVSEGRNLDEVDFGGEINISKTEEENFAHAVVNCLESPDQQPLKKNMKEPYQIEVGNEGNDPSFLTTGNSFGINYDCHTEIGLENHKHSSEVRVTSPVVMVKGDHEANTGSPVPVITMGMNIDSDPEFNEETCQHFERQTKLDVRRPSLTSLSSLSSTEVMLDPAYDSQERLDEPIAVSVMRRSKKKVRKSFSIDESSEKHQRKNRNQSPQGSIDESTEVDFTDVQEQGNKLNEVNNVGQQIEFEQTEAKDNVINNKSWYDYQIQDSATEQFSKSLELSKNEEMNQNLLTNRMYKMSQSVELDTSELLNRSEEFTKKGKCNINVEMDKSRVFSQSDDFDKRSGFKQSVEMSISGEFSQSADLSKSTEVFRGSEPHHGHSGNNLSSTGTSPSESPLSRSLERPSNRKVGFQQFKDKMQTKVTAKTKQIMQTIKDKNLLSKAREFAENFSQVQGQHEMLLATGGVFYIDEPDSGISSHTSPQYDSAEIEPDDIKESTTSQDILPPIVELIELEEATNKTLILLEDLNILLNDEATPKILSNWINILNQTFFKFHQLNSCSKYHIVPRHCDCLKNPGSVQGLVDLSDQSLSAFYEHNKMDVTGKNKPQNNEFETRIKEPEHVVVTFKEHCVIYGKSFCHTKDPLGLKPLLFSKVSELVQACFELGCHGNMLDLFHLQCEESGEIDAHTNNDGEGTSVAEITAATDNVKSDIYRINVNDDQMRTNDKNCVSDVDIHQCENLPSENGCSKTDASDLQGCDNSTIACDIHDTVVVSENIDSKGCSENECKIEDKSDYISESDLSPLTPGSGEDTSRSEPSPLIPGSGEDTSRSESSHLTPVTSEDKSRSGSSPLTPGSGEDTSKSESSHLTPVTSEEISRSGSSPLATGCSEDISRSSLFISGRGENISGSRSSPLNIHDGRQTVTFTSEAQNSSLRRLDSLVMFVRMYFPYLSPRLVKEKVSKNEDQPEVFAALMDCLQEISKLDREKYGIHQGQVIQHILDSRTMVDQGINLLGHIGQLFTDASPGVAEICARCYPIISPVEVLYLCQHYQVSMETFATYMKLMLEENKLNHRHSIKKDLYNHPSIRYTWLQTLLSCQKDLNQFDDSKMPRMRSHEAMWENQSELDAVLDAVICHGNTQEVEKTLHLCKSYGYWKGVLKLLHHLRRDLDIIEIIIHLGDIKLLNDSALGFQPKSEADWETVLTSFKKYHQKVGNQPGCADASDWSEQITWDNLGILLVRYIGPERALALLEKYCVNTRLSAEFFKTCLVSKLVSKHQRSILHAMLEKVDTYLWSVRPSSITNKLHYLAVNEKKLRCHGNNSVDQETLQTVARAVRADKSTHFYLDEPDCHWGIQVKFNRLCPCCNISLKQAVSHEESGVILFPCGHGYHKFCLPGKMCLLCDEPTA